MKKPMFLNLVLGALLAAGTVTGMLWLGPGNTVIQLSGIYLAAAVIAFAYFLYHPSSVMWRFMSEILYRSSRI